eukprot:1058847-Prorocentrum_minimum.AAC.1
MTDRTCRMRRCGAPSRSRTERTCCAWPGCPPAPPGAVSGRNVPPRAYRCDPPSHLPFDPHPTPS